jgi:hypothetical protein
VLDLSGKVDTSFPSWDFPDVQLQDCTQFLADEIFAALADRARGLGFPVP